jgi:hypothetical protein
MSDGMVRKYDKASKNGHIQDKRLSSLTIAHNGQFDSKSGLHKVRENSVVM